MKEPKARALPPEQEAIRAKCFHPSGTFTEFTKEEVEQSIPERFERIVRQRPDRLAVKAGDYSLTYDELNKAANRLAHAIVARQGPTVEPVALLFDQGAPLIAAMLGVLKAGKFFVLLDPSFPKAKIESVLEDSGAELTVFSRQYRSLTKDPQSSGCRGVEWESVHCDIQVEDLRLAISPRALAALFYTSGSTGKPKGVTQNHRNILHDAFLRTNAYHICKHDRLSLLASGTSNAVKNAFLSLLNGAVLLPFDVRRNGIARLATWLSEERISICRIGSPLYRKLCGLLTEMENFPDLRLVQLASEAIYNSDVDFYKKYFSRNCVLATGVSSSETGFLRDYLIDHKTENSGREVPVGYAVEGKEILLLDDQGKELGFNQVGEIAVRSRYLSPGYWRSPDLTGAKFKPDATGGEERLYFTGDLGLMLADGCLIHKGRKDFRCKIRGYGVEVAEVEKALRDHAAIRELVVAGEPDESGEARLVAYFTSHARPAPNVSELRRFLNERLPDYMIPSAFVALECLPLTPNGKIDRKSLPTPGNFRPELNVLFEEPRTPIEKALAQTWAEILSLDKVGIHDNFFDLGGHSLAATRVVSQVIKHFQIEIPLQSLFQSPTVAEMAAVIMEHRGKQLGEKDLDRILTELELLSDEETQLLLNEQTVTDSKKG